MIETAGIASQACSRRGVNMGATVVNRWSGGVEKVSRWKRKATAALLPGPANIFEDLRGIRI